MSSFRRKALKPALAALLLLVFSAPAWASLLSKMEWKVEKQFGIMTRDQMKSEYGFIQNPLLQKQIDAMGFGLAKVSHRTDIPYNFYVVDTDEVNAFAAPGGFVFVTRGLLLSADSDDEVAGVMGHEVGHVAAKHGYKNLRRMGLLIGGSLILSNNASKEVQQIASILYTLLDLHYSREDEYQADQLGAQYSYNSGWDPNGMLTFFNKLEKMYPSGNISKLEISLSTHPKTRNRTGTLERDYAALQPTNYDALMTIANNYSNRFRYYDAIQDYRKAAQAKPGAVEPIMAEARSLEALGQAAGAREAYQRVLDLEPGNNEAVQAISRIKTRDPQPQLPRTLTVYSGSEFEQAQGELADAGAAVDRDRIGMSAAVANGKKRIAAIRNDFDKDLPYASAVGEKLQDGDDYRIAVFNSFAGYITNFMSGISMADDVYTNAEDLLARSGDIIHQTNTTLATASSQGRAVSRRTLQFARELAQEARAVHEDLGNTLYEVKNQRQSLDGTYYEAFKVLGELDSSMSSGGKLEYYAKMDMTSRLDGVKSALSEQVQVMSNAREGLRDAQLRLDVAELNFNAATLTPAEENVYRQMLAFRFGMDADAIQEAEDKGYGFGDLVLLADRAASSNSTIEKLMADWGRLGPMTLALKKVTGKYDGTDILMHFARKDLDQLIEGVSGPVLEEVPPVPGAQSVGVEPTQDQKNALAQARELMSGGKTDDAENIYRQLVNDAPALIEAYVGLSKVYEAREEWRQMVDLAVKGQKHTARSADLTTIEAIGYYGLGDYYTAYALCSRAVKWDPNSVSAFYTLGRSAGEIGKDKESEDSFLAALDIDKNFYPAHNALGFLYYQQGKTKRAVDELQASLKIEPDQPRVREFLNRIKK